MSEANFRDKMRTVSKVFIVIGAIFVTVLAIDFIYEVADELIGNNWLRKSIVMVGGTIAGLPMAMFFDSLDQGWFDKRRSTRRIKGAPGNVILRVVDFLYSPKAVEEVFRPLVADWRFEYFEALQQKQKLKARWINVRYLYSFIIVIGLRRLSLLLKSLLTISK
jgi:hypothetical protein